MAKTRPQSPVSTITTTSVKSGPGGRKYTTHIEKSRPKYSFKVETKTSAQSAIPDEVELDGKHFRKWPGVLKLLQLVSIILIDNLFPIWIYKYIWLQFKLSFSILLQVVGILCMIFFSPPLTWFTRALCAVAAICFAVTVFICLFYLFTLRRVVFPSWPWLRMVSIAW